MEGGSARTASCGVMIWHMDHAAWQGHTKQSLGFREVRPPPLTLTKPAAGLCSVSMFGLHALPRQCAPMCLGLDDPPLKLGAKGAASSARRACMPIQALKLVNPAGPPDQAPPPLLHVRAPAASWRVHARSSSSCASRLARLRRGCCSRACTS